MKTLKKMTCTALILAMVTPFTQAALAEGSQTTDWPADPASHVVKIERTVIEPDDAKWITAAEHIPADGVALKQYLKVEVKNNQWWYDEFADVKIPFALTGDAVTYCTELVTSYGTKKMTRYLKPSSRFIYKATVSRKDKFTIDEKAFQNVTVVTLSMDFRFDSDQSIAFSKERVVVYDKDGKVLHISGDGEILIVSRGTI